MAGRARREGNGTTRREVVRPDDLAGLPTGIATRLHRNGLTTRGQVAAWYVRADAGRSLRGIGPRAEAIIAAWLGADEVGSR